MWSLLLPSLPHPSQPLNLCIRPLPRTNRVLKLCCYCPGIKVTIIWAILWRHVWSFTYLFAVSCYMTACTCMCDKMPILHNPSRDQLSTQSKFPFFVETLMISSHPSSGHQRNRRKFWVIFVQYCDVIYGHLRISFLVYVLWLYVVGYQPLTIVRMRGNFKYDVISSFAPTYIYPVLAK